jgi:hypothetical protein
LITASELGGVCGIPRHEREGSTQEGGVVVG